MNPTQFKVEQLNRAARIEPQLLALLTEVAEFAEFERRSAHAGATAGTDLSQPGAREELAGLRG